MRVEVNVSSWDPSTVCGKRQWLDALQRMGADVPCFHMEAGRDINAEIVVWVPFRFTEGPRHSDSAGEVNAWLTVAPVGDFVIRSGALCLAGSPEDSLEVVGIAFSAQSNEVLRRKMRWVAAVRGEAQA